jgi:FeS assembly SUF system protein
MQHMADTEMMKQALGDEYDEMVHPPNVVAPFDHALWPMIVKNLREVYDPEIPVNIYELGLIYKVEIDQHHNINVQMTLTSPACPVAGEMPGMVKDAIKPIESVADVFVEIIWEPTWNPGMMAETAKYQLNMF